MVAPTGQRVCVGVILGAHGVRGEVRIKSFTADPKDVAAFGPVETEDGARHFKLKVSRSIKDGVAASVSGVTDRDAAEALKGCMLYVSRAALPALQEDEDEFYLVDLIGLAVRWVEGPPQEGKILAVHNFGAGDLIEVATGTGGDEKKTLLLPFEREVVPEVNLAGGYVRIRLPLEVSEEDKE